MQLNGIFARILRSLGYTVVTLGGRVSRAAGFDVVSADCKPEDITFGGLGHQISLVIINGKKYFCDVGFGNTGPTFPVPLESGFSQVNTGFGDQVATSMKIVKAHIANNTGHEPEQLLWQYWVKYGVVEDDSKPWIPLYCFAETEFFAPDYDVMNWYVSTNKKSIFVQHVICSKFIMSEDKQHLIGDITLNGTVLKERRFGKSRELVEIKSEKDRTDALAKFMGVSLSEIEKAGIEGFPSMVR